MCHFWIGSCRFVCPGQLPIYSGIPPLPSTFAKFSPLTFLVQSLIQKSLRPQAPSVQIQVSSLFLIFRFFQLFQKFLRFLFLHPTIVRKRLQTNIMIQVIIALIIAVIAMKRVLRTRDTLLASLGFLWKSSKNSLGKPLAPKLVYCLVYLHPVLQTRRKPYSAVQLVSTPK